MVELQVAGGHPFRHRGTKADEGVVEQMFRYEDYHLGRLRRGAGLLERYERASRPLIVDCGANIGASTVWFARSFPRATVVALEPEAANFELLSANVAALGNVRAYQAAIGPEPGQAFVTDPGEGEWGYRTEAEPADTGRIVGAVEVMALDDILRAHEADLHFILKIDIEGGERELFSANTAGMDPFALLIVELHDWLLPGSASSRNFLRWHAGTDRDFVYLGENIFSIRNS